MVKLREQIFKICLFLISTNTALTYLYIFQRCFGVLAVYYLPKFDISLQCCYSWHTSTQYYKTLPITKLHRIIAQEIKFWSKYPSLCYITTTELRWEISNFNSYNTCIYLYIILYISRGITSQNFLYIKCNVSLTCNLAGWCVGG